MVEVIKIADQHLIGLLTKQGINPQFVTLKQDYASHTLGKEHSPYARFWEDTKSRKRIMEVGILPRVTNAGFFVVPRFKQVGKKFITEENCFEAEIDKDNSIRVVCVNDQPNGRKGGDWAKWCPQVFLGGVEQPCGKPLWLETDHINPNYHFNVIEWNYGFCKRRARNIEGRFKDKITLASNPSWEVRIKNNVTGNMRLKFGSVDAEGLPIGIVRGDEEIISKEELATAKYPITIGASPETFYPAAGASSPVDGHVGWYNSTGVSWISIVGQGGSEADDARESSAGFYVYADNVTDTWGRVRRGIYLFNTANLPGACTVTGVVLSLFGQGKDDTGLSYDPELNIYSSAPADNDALVAGDYDSLGTEALSSVITYANWSVVAYNDFTLIDVNTDDFATNEDGTYINKTGITKLGSTDAKYDTANRLDAGAADPNWVSTESQYMYCYHADQGDTTNDPKLVVTYSVGAVQAGAAVLSGVGTLTGLANLIYSAQATLAGLGTLTAIGRLLRVGLATFSGTGTLSALGRRFKTGIATLAGTGTLVALGKRFRTGATTLSGTGTLIASGTRILIGKATLAGVGFLSVIGTVGEILYGGMVLSGVGLLSIISKVINHRYLVRPPDSTDTAVTKTGRYGERE